MKIFEENGKIRFQLAEWKFNQWNMLFDFTIEKDAFHELKDHMIESLNGFEVDKK